jgi:hypothetical protein
MPFLEKIKRKTIIHLPPKVTEEELTSTFGYKHWRYFFINLECGDVYLPGERNHFEEY